ncbi:hypothetical protein EV141_1762 [Microcella putealis]|uniref:DUF4190 domain-containing protein n=1 Tax=Microcella putealis TaxID=337005 RepID=A0A4Q7LNK4_9MICO|nr:DUF4190 domain-containing protein [Microcella putealis]RZS56305.1 hypothetical protein EV141_1762 [Microcella putealis]TQM27209.1 hypothetical protein BJ957_0639 [Microcella putealis]
MTDAPPPAYSQPAQPAVNPGQTLGIVALICSFFFQILGLILGIVALNQSKKVGMKNGLAVAAIWISAILLVLGVIIFIVSIALFGSLAAFTTEYSFAP